MYCAKCGNEIPEGFDVCPKCDAVVKSNNNEISSEEISEENVVLEEGIILDETDNNPAYIPYDQPSNAIAALGLVLPPIGIIYYFTTRKDTPMKAKSALRGVFAGIIVYALAAIIFNFVALPYIKNLAFKMQCEGNKSGAVYDMETSTCKYPDGRCLL